MSNILYQIPVDKTWTTLPGADYLVWLAEAAVNNSILEGESSCSINIIFSTFEILVKAARFSKPSPYFKPKYFIFQHSVCLFLRCQNVNQIIGKTNARLLLLVK